MGNLSKNLSRHEMACQCCCGFDTVDIELVNVLQALCDHYLNDTGFKVILVITGPNRCAKHNAETEGAAKNSQHIYARAADFKLFIVKHGVKEQIPPKDVYKHLDEKYQGKFGVGLYHNRCHVDTRSNGVWRSEG